MDRRRWACAPSFWEWKLNAVHSVAYQAWNIRLTSKGSDQTVRIRMLVWAFACRTYHIVGNLKSWLLLREMLQPAITDFILLWGQEHGCRPISKLNSNSKHQEVVSHYIFKESLNLHFCVYVHFFDMKTKKNETKKLGHPGFEPIIYVLGALLTNHTTTVESTTSLSYQWIASQMYQDVYFRNCSKHTDCTRSITEKYIFSVNNVIIYSCIKVRIRLIL